MYAWLEFLAPYFAPWALIIAIAAVLWAFFLWQRLRQLEARYVELTAGTAGGSLEEVLNSHLDNVRTAVEKASEAWETAVRVERSGRSHLQHAAVVRYNPFNHTGGDQSFVLALADGDGNGAVVNSLHARDGTRIYAKPLAGWESTHILTEEEQDAIAKARGLQAKGTRRNPESL